MHRIFDSADKTSPKTIAKLVIAIGLVLGSFFPVLMAGAHNVFADSQSPILSFIPLSTGGSNVAVNPSTNLVYVATGGALLIIDGSTDTQVGSITIPQPTPGADPYDIALNPNTNTIYASTGIADSVIVIDCTSKSVKATISFDSFAGFLGLNPATNRIFVEHGSDQVYSDKISVIDGTTNSVVGNITLDRSSMGDIAANPVTNTIYVGSMYADSVSVVDGNTLSVVAKIPVGTYPDKVAVNPVTNMVYVTNYYDDTVSVVDGKTNSVVATIPITGYHPWFTGVYPFGIDVDTKTNRVYVADETGAAISIIDGNTNTLASTVNLVDSTGQSANTPQYVSVNPNTGKAYVNVYGSLLAMVHYGNVTQTTTTVTVNSVDANNNPLNGYYTKLTQNGATANTGFTPVPFTVTIGQTYTLEIQDFGGYYFSHWSDNGSTARDRTFSATSSPQAFTAVFSTTTSSGTTSGSTGTGISRAIVNSQDTNGNAIGGYYTILSQNGATVNSGFTPTTFPTTAGQTYSIEVQDYGNYYFNHWLDTGSASRDRTFTTTQSEQTFTAVYSTSPSSVQSGSTGSQSTISVTTVDPSGTPITDYYVSLWQNGAQIGSAFSPATLNVGNNQAYQVAASDYGNYAFDHWSDGTTNRFHDVSTGTGTSTALTAIYKIQ